MFIFGNIIAAAVSLHPLMIIIIFIFRLKINNELNIHTA